MSFTVDLITEELPPNDKAAWRVIEDMRAFYYDDVSAKNEKLLELHGILTSRYPCLCSYVDDDPEMEKSPWADGPLLDNLANRMGMLAIVYSRVDEVFPFILESALELGITVADGQSEKIYRPGESMRLETGKPWWKFW